MTFRNAQPPQLNLSRRPYELPFFVDMEAFFEFSFWISEELLDLEAADKLKRAPVRNHAEALPASISQRLRSVV